MDRLHGVTDVVSEMDRMRQLGRTGRLPDDDREPAAPWVPTTDIFARGEDVVIQLELAGVAADDVEVSFAGGVLTVSGARKRPSADQSAEPYVRERFYGAFRRSVTLPAGVDADSIDAYFDNGLVEVVARRGAASTRSRRIALRERTTEDKHGAGLG